ncbi:hypothetical protein BASA50_004441 [Batrachochytrium salamandrivorans]|uniref:Ceramide very long chain fatty acid hydroxylase n=1 Tax=Batrachochytrium salamandrivorans TaxID=1357716 RepID=A0ABQ8FFT9_9FUNG|nr:hypothetical protein BASA62_003356 [Batrachochytrium salamandrivorans]KAH6581247.1 hypothetical protein BASA60_002524 [Batrachochytrium salamandrivorans]KAH6588171.1 hypothetical protein BASA61_006076 [Batrachochytrium salamandrivorans]KAH6597524.1 hypothetical protein BASA50_004441 [Batrachochytrium salamandrivorans]KAJ1330698.1 hypothetical protein BSLG_009150 [Batrachochytrium salamandrivorans]
MTVSKTFFSLEEVAANHTTDSLWVINDNKVYDISQFMFDHPGGQEILLQYGGQDITKVLQDVNEHQHSEVAYDMLEPFYIGELEAGARTKSTSASTPQKPLNDPSKNFIDVNKPMLRQVWVNGWSKDFYLEMVHIPRHTKDSAPIFGHPFLEVFTKTPWWGIPVFWSPIVTYCILDALKTLTLWDIAICFFIGVVNWSFIEYGLHRFLFHIDAFLPNHPAALTLHFLLHGIHHFLPMDKMRLVMPPVLGFVLAYPIWCLYVVTLPGGYGQAMVSGSMVGFVLYDLIHYYIHHGQPFGEHLREMKSYHMNHHYKNPNLGFGITSKLWDYVFNTTL